VFLISPWAEFSSFWGIFDFYHRQVAPKKKRKKEEKREIQTFLLLLLQPPQKNKHKQKQKKKNEQINAERKLRGRMGNNQIRPILFSCGGVSVSLQMLEERNALDDFQIINATEIVSPFLLAGISN
jgi:hypothetical protein